MSRGWLWAAGICALAGLGLAAGYSPMHFTAFLLLCAAAVLLLWGFLSRRRQYRAFRIARRALAACLLAGFCLFAVLEVRVISWARTDRDTPTAAVVILGAGVNGTEPSLSLLVRLETALDYVADKPDIPIVVSGAQGPGEEISEARCMADWLTARGVASERICMEEQATSTEENIRYSKAILAEGGIGPGEPVAVVSSDYHLARAAAMWGDGFVPVAASMPGRYLPLTVNYYIREAFGLAAYLVFGR